MSQPLVVVKTSTLSDAQRTAFISHLAGLSSLRLEGAQFNFGNKVTLEVAVPLRHVNDLHKQIGLPAPFPTQALHSRGGNIVSFDVSSIGGLSPIVGTRRGGAETQTSPPRPALSYDAAPSEPNRSCQWLHRMVDEIYVFRQRKYHFEFMEASQPACGPVHSRSRPQTSRPNSRTPIRRGTSPAAAKEILLSDRNSTGVGRAPATDDLSVVAFKYLSEKFGMTTMVRQHASELLECVRAYRSHDLDIQLFGLFLMSQAYDTADLMAFMKWRDILIPYSIQKQESTSASNATSVLRRFVRVREIPGLFRKCLVDRCEHSAQDAFEHEAHWHRVRAALHSWCDPLGRFPAVVPDPNFYCPPFRLTNPYVGRLSTLGDTDSARNSGALRKTLLAYEGRFQAFSANQVVPMAQLLMVLLLCWKEERLNPSPENFLASQRLLTPQRSHSANTRRHGIRSPVAGKRGDRPQQALTPHRASKALLHKNPEERNNLYSSLMAMHGAEHAQDRSSHAAPASTPPPGSRSTSAVGDSPTETAGGCSDNSPPNHPQSQPPQPHPPMRPSHTTPPQPSRKATSAITKIADLSPNFNPFASPVHKDPASSPHRQEATPGGASPSLRDEEEQFYKDLLSLEARLVRVHRGGKKTQVTV